MGSRDPCRGDDTGSKHRFAPTTLAIGVIERLEARLGRANIAFDDHPPERRFAGRIDTVSVESVAAFMLRQAVDTQSLTIRLE